MELDCRAHSVWHDADETPNNNSWLIVVYPDGCGGFVPEAEWYMSVKYWAMEVQHNKIVKWCYFDDII